MNFIADTHGFHSMTSFMLPGRRLNIGALLSLQQAQQVIEQHLAILDTEDWGSGLLCAGVWPDGFPSALLSTEDSCFSAVLRDGQVLSFCLNTLSLQGKR